MSDKFHFEFNFRDSNNSDELSPLVIMLHGYGSNEDDLFSFANHIPGNYKIISLRAPYSLPYGGYSWYDISSDDLEAKKIKIGVEQAKSSISKIKDFGFFSFNILITSYIKAPRGSLKPPFCPTLLKAWHGNPAHKIS